MKNDVINYEVIVFNEFFIKPDFIDHFIDAQTENVDLVREEQDAARGEMRFFHDQKDKTSMFVLGRNLKQEDLVEHVKKITERGIAQREADSVSKETIVRFLSPIDSRNGAYITTPITASPFVVYRRFAIKDELIENSISTIKKYLAEVSSSKGTLLCDFYQVVGEGVKNEFILHSEFESQTEYLKNHEENPILSGFDDWVSQAVDSTNDKKFLTEINRLL